MRKHYRRPLLQISVHIGRRIWCNCQHCGCWWFERWNPPSRRWRWADKRCPLKVPQLPHMMLLLEGRDRKDRACSTILVRSGLESSVSVSVLISIHELIANCWCILPRSAMIISVLCYKKCILAKIASSQTYFDPPKSSPVDKLTKRRWLVPKEWITIAVETWSELQLDRGN